jgi:short-subunit dehydrogenase
MKSEKYFNGKIAWITGGSSGIGEALVKTFAKYGATVIASSNDAAGLERMKNECPENKEKIHCVPFDFRDTLQIEACVRRQMKKFDRIDFLINVGGVSQRAKITETSMRLERKIFEINYFGTVTLTKAILPYMINQKSGHILATSSISGRFGFPLRSAYSASKQALHGFIETLYLENKQNNIRASVIIPGRVRTSISIHALTSSGQEHGKLDDGQAKGITSEKAAMQIIKGIKKNKREILVGGEELMMLHIRRYFPWLFFRIADKIKST